MIPKVNTTVTTTANPHSHHFPTFDPVHFNRNRPGALLARLSECLLIHAVLVRLSILGWGATEEELRK
jgi:hypothetical protein